jgi:hypothetical protein
MANKYYSKKANGKFDDPDEAKASKPIPSSAYPDFTGQPTLSVKGGATIMSNEDIRKARSTPSVTDYKKKKKK